MKVLKFGGTSVGSVESILSVKKIVEAIEEPVIVVVSALGGITDKLLKTASMATNGDVAYEREFSEIVARHLDVIQGVIPDKTKRIEVQKQVMALLDELGNIYKGVPHQRLVGQNFRHDRQLRRTYLLSDRFERDKRGQTVRLAQIHQNGQTVQQAYRRFRIDKPPDRRNIRPAA